MERTLRVVLGLPEEAELVLLEELAARDDTEIIAVIDPGGTSLGASLAEVMGLPVHADLAAAGRLDGVVCVLPGQPSAAANDLAADAEKRGLEVTGADVLLRRLRLRTPPRRATGPVLAPLDELETRAGAVESGLAVLEEALAGDAILQRLLELATRAVGAASGSVMLHDEASRELYIAYATGLSEATVHRTRVRLGESIAGRVARDRRPELVTGTHGDPTGRDRPDIASAISAPLVWEGRLLGVLNVSTGHGERALGSRERDVLADLAGRLGRILDRVQRLQDSRTAQIVRLTETRLRALRTDAGSLPDLLAAWAAALATAAAAELVTIAVPCHDGSCLLLGEADATGTGRSRHEVHDHPAWIEVLGAGAPVIVRHDGAGDPLTAFFLPVGAVAGLGVQFRHGGPAHAFHGLASGLVGVLGGLLEDELERHVRTRQRERLADLSETLAAVAQQDATPGQRAERLCAEAARVAGAREAVVVAAIEKGRVRLAAGNVADDAPWLDEIPRWLEEAGPGGWRITTAAVEPGPSVSVLVVRSAPDRPVPGLVLVGKERLDPLDGEAFSEEDLGLVRPLVQLLATLPAPATALGDLATGGRDGLLAALTREMDRCDRYHTQLGLVVLGPRPGAGSPSTTALGVQLRSSDQIFALPGGVVAVLAPEDVLSLDRLQGRLVDAWSDLTGAAPEGVRAARAIYPGRQRTPESLLDHVLSALR